MNGQRLSCGTIAFVLAMSAGPLMAADDPLAHVKRLYMAAHYEEALAVLSRATPAGSSEADEYRVLCLLALGREADAERIVERLVLRNPLASPDQAGRSPQFTATLLKVRQRTLGLVAYTIYGLARASFDAGNVAVALAQFRELVTLLEKNDRNEEPLAELRMLADGFSRLSHQQADAVKPSARASSAKIQAAADTPATAVPGAADVLVDETMVAVVSPPEALISAADDGKPFAPWRPQVFGSEDREVTPPAIVDQQMPAWIAPPAYANATLRGTLEIIVGENGLVTSVRSVARTHPQYDTMLLVAARRWRYEPAIRDGQPVKYRKMLDYTLRAR